MAKPVFTGTIPDFVTGVVGPLFDGSIPNFEAGKDVLFSYDAMQHFLTGTFPTEFTMQNAPAWLDINNDGVISGIPQNIGLNSSITVTASNTLGNDISNSFNITVILPPKFILIGCQGRA